MDYAVCPVSKDTGNIQRAIKLADEVGCEIIDINDVAKYDAVLYISSQGLYLDLGLGEQGYSGKCYLAIGWQSLDFYTWAGRRPNQPLLKAVRGSKRPLRKGGIILDGTAGLGNDSWLLANFGYQVIAVEKNPLIFALLRESLSQAAIDYPEITRCLRIENANTQDILERLIHRQKDPNMVDNSIWDYLRAPDVIYLDPLFPKEQHKKKAVKKSMCFLRAVLRDETMELSLLHKALAVAKKRVVLKRPLKSEIISIGKVQPVHRAKGKAVRYDVYVP